MVARAQSRVGGIKQAARKTDPPSPGSGVAGNPSLLKLRRGKAGEFGVPFGVQNRFLEGDFPDVHEIAVFGENGDAGGNDVAPVCL